MNKKIKVTMLVAAVALAGGGTWKAYDYSESHKQSLMAYNVEAKAGVWEDFWNTLTNPVEAFMEWYDSKIYGKQEVYVTKTIKAGVNVGFSYQILKRFEVDCVSYIEIRFKCNMCVNGNSYAHCDEIPNLCDDYISKIANTN